MITSDVKRYTFNIIHVFNTSHYETIIHYWMGINIVKFISLTKIKNFLLVSENS